VAAGTCDAHDPRASLSGVAAIAMIAPLQYRE